MAPDELASAPHSTAVRGGAVGGAAAASSEPPGLRRPEASHPPAGRPEPRATSPALPIAGAGGKRPALRDGSPAPGRVPQMAVGRGKRPRLFSLGPGPECYPGPSPDGEEDRHRSRRP